MKIKNWLKVAVIGLALQGAAHGNTVINGDASFNTKNVDVRIQQSADSARYTNANFNVKFCKDKSLKLGSRASWKSDLEFVKTDGFALEPFIRKKYDNLDVGANYFYSSDGDSTNSTVRKSFSVDGSLKPIKYNTVGAYFSEGSRVHNRNKTSVINDNSYFTGIETKNLKNKLGINHLLNSKDVKLFSKWEKRENVTRTDIRLVYDLVDTSYFVETYVPSNNFSVEGLFRVDGTAGLDVKGSYNRVNIESERNFTQINTFDVGGGFQKLSLGKLLIKGYGGYVSQDSRNENTMQDLIIINKDKTEWGYLGLEIHSEKSLENHNKRLFDEKHLVAMNTNYILDDLEDVLKRKDYLSNDGFLIRGGVEKILKSDYEQKYSFSVEGMLAIHPSVRLFGSYGESVSSSKNWDSRGSSYVLGLLVGNPKMNMELTYGNSSTDHSFRGKDVVDRFGLAINYGGISK